MSQERDQTDDESSLFGLAPELPDIWTFVSIGSLAIILLYAKQADGYGLYPLAVAGLLMPKLRRHWLLWAGFALVMTPDLIANFDIRDDHQFLYTYWMVAMAFATAADPDRRRELLAFNGRLLIGLTFGWATFWKLTSPEFTDGSFFEYLLLTTPRGSHIPVLFTGLDAEALAEHHERLGDLRDNTGSAMPESVSLNSTPGLSWLAVVMTIGTAVVEGAVALLFLLPRKPWIRRGAHLALLAFLSTTYLFIPVVGFAGILIVMAMAQCREEDGTIRLAYLTLFIALPALPLLAVN